MSQDDRTTRVTFERFPQDSYHVSFVTDWRTLKIMTLFCKELSAAMESGRCASSNVGSFQPRHTLAAGQLGRRFRSFLASKELPDSVLAGFAKKMRNLDRSISGCDSRFVNLYIGDYWKDHPEEGSVDSAVSTRARATSAGTSTTRGNTARSRNGNRAS